MKPERLTSLMKKAGSLETFEAGQVYHTQAFNEALYMLKSGYVKRYQISDNKRVIELIYGPGHIFPLTHLYKKLFMTDHNQDNMVYVYQAMTDIEIYRVDVNEIIEAAEQEPKLYIDLFYEAGLRLKSNISRLASNALQDDYKKVAHQLVSLADEFADGASDKSAPVIKIPIPLQPIDIAEQLNISVEVTDAILDGLKKNGLIEVKKGYVYIPNMDLLKDAYL